MSYCRWSSMNWACDVYVYESVDGGWMTHVAANHRAWAPIPEFPLMSMPSFGAQLNNDRKLVYPSKLHALAARIAFGAWALWHNHVHMRSLHIIPLRKINRPFAGETFCDPDPYDCADRLEHLRSLGYTVPQYAIDALRAEDYPEEKA